MKVHEILTEEINLIKFRSECIDAVIGIIQQSISDVIDANIQSTDINEYDSKFFQAFLTNATQVIEDFIWYVLQHQPLSVETYEVYEEVEDKVQFDWTIEGGGYINRQLQLFIAINYLFHIQNWFTSIITITSDINQTLNNALNNISKHFNRDIRIIIHEMVGTIIHESVHLIQFLQQIEHGYDDSKKWEYRSYLEPNQEKFYNIVNNKIGVPGIKA